jgi:hypothetical protein
LADAAAVTPGATLALPATTPTATIRVAKRTHRWRGVRRSIIVPLRVVDR